MNLIPHLATFEPIVYQNLLFASPDGYLIHWLVVIFGTILFVFLLTQAIICNSSSKTLKTIPKKYRQISPSVIWLLMIPIFHLFWNFFVFLQITKSLKKFAETHGDQTVGDCGETLAWSYCFSNLSYYILGILMPLGFPLALLLWLLYRSKVNRTISRLNHRYR